MFSFATRLPGILKFIGKISGSHLMENHTKGPFLRQDFTQSVMLASEPSLISLNTSYGGIQVCLYVSNRSDACYTASIRQAD
jgi:hypothetical protein